jgi:imidazolonepropionase-like amidohydrolase
LKPLANASTATTLEQELEAINRETHRSEFRRQLRGTRSRLLSPDEHPSMSALIVSLGRAASILALAVGAAGAVSLQPRTTAADVAVRAARWLDPVSGQLRGPVAILVSGQKIAQVVPGSAFDEKAARSVIDLGNATLLPGLIDGHVHLQIGGPPADNATATLRAGFTTLVDLGATSDAVLRLRDAIAAGNVEGPRILAAGRWIGTKNGICEFGGIGIAGGPENFRARVRENVDAGADLTKVCVSEWTAAAFAQPDAYEIKDDALAAVVEESRRSNRIVIAHAISLGGAKAASRAGVHGLAHAAYLDAATAAELRERDMLLIPTILTLAGAPGPAADALKASVATAHRAGVRLVFGTDGGVLPHGKNAAEFQALVNAGVPPIVAMRAATTTAAHAFGLADAIGSLDEGKFADIIAVDGDPVSDVTALQRIVFVMRNGRAIVSK